MIARAIAGRIGRFFTSDRIKARLAFLETKEQALARRSARAFAFDRPGTDLLFRMSAQHLHQCAGGSRALAGIGCHYMATWMPERHTGTFAQMGGEGVPWVGQAPFTTESTCSPTSATAPTSIRACSRSARRWRQR